MNFKMANIVGTPFINRDLVLEFFMFFSRFEYSLKRSGFLKSGENAMANWDTYANILRGKFATVENPTFQKAIAYLKSNPPKTQIATENDLSWRDTVQGPGEHDERYILRLVCTTRNNLFHGGKFLVGPVEDVSRNEQLLQESITILNQCLTLSNSIQSIFCETA